MIYRVLGYSLMGFLIVGFLFFSTGVNITYWNTHTIVYDSIDVEWFTIRRLNNNFYTIFRSVGDVVDVVLWNPFEYLKIPLIPYFVQPEWYEFIINVLIFLVNAITSVINFITGFFNLVGELAKTVIKFGNSLFIWLAQGYGNVQPI